ncbi:hypothetical protein CTA2_10738 [Colletotrichum tanaceti]|uniref:Uncharacterized protein n=1 Tax=Colletotrichum tanaceti TaxID=1306861 RepID=A0A4U6X271_9PEZI|nr:hypothetical protein CTA2_10738 [Colletotrichum tanaceti]TKW49468.1 hypothetical protein CTA1_1321 [Colletotrichum tanaceti]
MKKLPYDILLMVLERVEDFMTLATAVEAFPPFYDVFTRHSGVIVERISATMCARVRAYEVGDLYQQLEFAIRRCFIPRADLETAFTMSWPIFAARELGETLLPLARALAWTYCIDENEEAAVKFLEKVWDGSQPLTWPIRKGTATSPPERPPSYATVGFLLLDLLDETKKASILAQMQRMSRLRNIPWSGIRFNENGVPVLARTVSDTIPVYHPPRFLLGSNA